MGGFGGMIVVLGQRLIGLQTGAWLIFGVVYLGLGATILAGWDKPMRRRFGVAPDRWKMASSPLLQGLAFGLNIPACAAPILFGSMGPATAIGSASMGFLMMAVFALALSLPLIPLSVILGLARPLGRQFLQKADWSRAALRPRGWSDLR